MKKFMKNNMIGNRSVIIRGQMSKHSIDNPLKVALTFLFPSWLVRKAIEEVHVNANK